MLLQTVKSNLLRAIYSSMLLDSHLETRDIFLILKRIKLRKLQISLGK